MRPASNYAQITNSVNAMTSAVSGMSPEDAERALYMIARAALIRLSAIRGMPKAAETAYQLGDELAGSGR